MNECHLSDYLQNLIIGNVGTNLLKIFNKYMDLIPDLVNLKHLSINEERYFTNFEQDSFESRVVPFNLAFTVADCLAKRRSKIGQNIINIDKSKNKSLPQLEGMQNYRRVLLQEHNFVEYLLEKNGFSHQYIKFFLTSKLPNLTISNYSLDCLSKVFKTKQMNYWATLHSIKSNFKSNIKAFEGHEIINVTIIPTIKELLEYYNIKLCINTLKIDTDNDFMFKGINSFKDNSDRTSYHKKPNFWAAEGQGQEFMNSDLLDGNLSKILNNPQLVNTWNYYLSESEKLNLLFLRVESVFEFVYRNQTEFLEFSDYNDEGKKMEMNDFRINLKSNRGGTNVEKISNLKEFLEGQDNIMLTSAFWVKQDLVFKLPEKTADEFYKDVNLENQETHPFIHDWYNLVLMNSKEDVERRIEELVEINLGYEKIDVLKRDEHTDLIRKSYRAYFKLMVLRARTSSLKMVSYFNYFRSVQKSINIKFLNLCESNKHSDDVWAKDTPKVFDRTKLFAERASFGTSIFSETSDLFTDPNTRAQPHDTSTQGLHNLRSNLYEKSNLVTQGTTKNIENTNPTSGSCIGTPMPNVCTETEDPFAAYTDDCSEIGRQKNYPQNSL